MAIPLFQSSSKETRLQLSNRDRPGLVCARHAPRAEIAFGHHAAERQLAAKWNFFDAAFGLRLVTLAAVIRRKPANTPTTTQRYR
jgi:hypothetical protein